MEASKAFPGYEEIQPAPGFDQIHILWTSEGMSCDGDTVSVTAATQPRLEDVLLGNIPGLPKVHLHNKVLSPTLGGDEFLAPFFAAARGEQGALDTFVRELKRSSPRSRVVVLDFFETFEY